jgi:hypothetical protein
MIIILSLCFRPPLFARLFGETQNSAESRGESHRRQLPRSGALGHPASTARAKRVEPIAFDVRGSRLLIAMAGLIFS